MSICYFTPAETAEALGYSLGGFKNLKRRYSIPPAIQVGTRHGYSPQQRRWLKTNLPGKNVQHNAQSWEPPGITRPPARYINTRSIADHLGLQQTQITRALTHIPLKPTVMLGKMQGYTLPDVERWAQTLD